MYRPHLRTAALALGVAHLVLALVWSGLIILFSDRLLEKPEPYRELAWLLARVAFPLILGPPVLAAWVGAHILLNGKGDAAGAAAEPARPRPIDVMFGLLAIFAGVWLGQLAVGPLQDTLTAALRTDLPDDMVAKAAVVHMLLVGVFLALAGLWIVLRGVRIPSARPAGGPLVNILPGLLILLGFVWSSTTGLCAFNPHLGRELWLLGLMLFAPGLAAVAAGWALWNRR